MTPWNFFNTLLKQSNKIYIGAGTALWKPPCRPTILNTVAEMDRAFLLGFILCMRLETSHLRSIAYCLYILSRSQKALSKFIWLFNICTFISISCPFHNDFLLLLICFLHNCPVLFHIHLIIFLAPIPVSWTEVRTLTHKNVKKHAYFLSTLL